MNVKVQFFSYLKELTGRSEITKSLPEGSNIGQLLESLYTDFPKLADMKRSTLVAVGVDYQAPDYVLQDGDEVSLFPPVQGG